MIHSQLAAFFPAAVRERARDYLSPDRLEVMDVQPVLVLAVVRGTELYTAHISAQGTQVGLGCSCPASVENGACKHLWALLSVLDAHGKLPVALADGAPTPAVRFEPEEPASEELVHALHERYGPPNACLTRELAPAPAVPATPVEPWRAALQQVTALQAQQPLLAGRERARSMPPDRRIVYLVHVTARSHSEGVRVEVATQRRNRDGAYDEPRHFGFAAEAWYEAPDATDRLIANLLLGTAQHDHVTGMPPDGFVVPARAFGTTLRMICDTGRAMIRSQKPSLDKRVLRWDDGAPYTVQLQVNAPPSGHYTLSGTLTRDGRSLPLHEVDHLAASGLVLLRDTLARYEAGALQPLAMVLWRDEELDLGEDPSAFLEQYHATPGMPTLSLPDGAMHTEVDVVPERYLRAHAGDPTARRPFTRLVVRFRYGNAFVDAHAPMPWVFDRTSRTLYRRRASIEREALARVKAVGAQETYWHAEQRMTLTIASPQAVHALASLARDGWHVEHEGRPLIPAGAVQFTARSGVDWFDLEGIVPFGAHQVALGDLLKARASGAMHLELPDGSLGVIPQDRLLEWDAMLALGEQRGNTLRFGRGQLAVIDVLLESLPHVDVDAQFANARAQLHSFRSVHAVPVPEGFIGELRGYQREALGWFAFLRQFGLGGCLADDMGLGKTVQVLALLEARRAEGAGLSLLVVPRSLVFNWVQEAARFTPQLRVVDLSQGDRTAVSLDELHADVVITTYGTLRRDVALLGQRRFDYVVLDEAQAIKNASTATAKAARVLQADHRLALTGTPIENRIEELWSLFEFLNRGMLGQATRFSAAARLLSPSPRPFSPTGVPAEGESDDVLSRALRPVILRRTKAQVATELPPRTEQTLEVELEPEQRAFYEAVRMEYAERLFAQVERDGFAKARMHILEGLLRLRQAACHPVLVEPGQAQLPSAKLDALIPALQDITAEGHKVLVFSQFTSFLSLVKERLDAVGVPYEYLDGRTRDRAARVTRFQSAEGAPVFLISLKAGGHGLNLTAAEYVYLLDPWWNPAVEAQAIDRAHRIGQTRHVLATRLVARDTIESKILKLQASKRALADAILGEDKGGLGAIGRAELELLFG